MTSNMDWEKENLSSFVENLYSGNNESYISSVIYLKNLVIGSNKQKDCVIQAGTVPRLLELLSDESSDDAQCAQLRYEVGVLLCSLCKGTRENVKTLMDAGIIPMLMTCITSAKSSKPLVEICLRSLRSLFVTDLAPVKVVYEPCISGVPLAVYLLNAAGSAGCSWAIQEAVVNILAFACQTVEHQKLLCEYSALGTVANLLQSPAYKVQLPTLHLLAQLVHNNETVAAVALNTLTTDDRKLVEIVYEQVSMDRTKQMQLAAAKCMANLVRSKAMGLLEGQKYVYKTLRSLCKLCKKENEAPIRAEAASTLAFLCEADPELQRLASISDHIVPTLFEYFKYNPTLPTACGEAISPAAMKRAQLEQKHAVQMKDAAFTALASIAASDEEIRKKIIEMDGLMEHIVSGLSDGGSDGTRLAALRCLHSLSRSVQQLRTSFADHAVWVPLKTLLLTTSDDHVLSMASATLCNLLLEFSPSKQHFLDRAALEFLCGLTRREEPELRVNGVWALMHMAYQADQSLKTQMMACLGADQLFALLNESDTAILMKAMGFVRNLLSTKAHIDLIMKSHGKQIMTAVTSKLKDGDCTSPEVKEQALCILSNIASGDSAKEFIMLNDDVLKKLAKYMTDETIKLQIAAVFAVNNLVWSSDAGSGERQAKLRELGFYKTLQQLIHTTDDQLFDKVKTALQQFNDKD